MKVWQDGMLWLHTCQPRMRLTLLACGRPPCPYTGKAGAACMRQAPASAMSDRRRPRVSGLCHDHARQALLLWLLGLTAWGLGAALHSPARLGLEELPSRLLSHLHGCPYSGTVGAAHQDRIHVCFGKQPRLLATSTFGIAAWPLRAGCMQLDGPVSAQSASHHRV